MTDTPAHQLAVERVPTDTLTAHERNPRRGDIARVADSLLINGQYRPLVVARDGTIIAGNHTWQAVKRLGWTEVDITRLDIDPDSDEAWRIMLADNRTSDLGTYDDTLLLSILDALPDATLGTGYDDDDIAYLRHTLERFDDHASILEANRHRPPVRRTLPVRASISLAGGNKDHHVVIRLLGFEYGLLSTNAERYLGRMHEQIPVYLDGIRIAFMDNPWHGYDHTHHVAMCERIRPVAATTRDIMTKEQCEQQGIEYLTVAETLAMAADVARYVDEVILIPKFDCIDDLPERIGDAKVVLGYSVPSSYGATEVDPDAFRGRPIHLLGGSWPRQHALLHHLGEDIVSLDSNYMSRMSAFGSYWLPCSSGGGGSTRQVQDLGFQNVHQRGLNMVAMMLSLLAMSTDLIEWNGGGFVPPPFDDDDADIPQPRPGQGIDIDEATT
jgi:hypothetical protein